MSSTPRHFEIARVPCSHTTAQSRKAGHGNSVRELKLTTLHRHPRSPRSQDRSSSRLLSMLARSHMHGAAHAFAMLVSFSLGRCHSVFLSRCHHIRARVRSRMHVCSALLKQKHVPLRVVAHAVCDAHARRDESLCSRRRHHPLGAAFTAASSTRTTH